MADVFISEFGGSGPLVSKKYGNDFPQAPSLAEQKVTIGATSAASAAFNSGTSLVRVKAMAACHVVVGGSAPVATTNSMPMANGETQFFNVKPGDKVAVIQPAG